MIHALEKNKIESNIREGFKASEDTFTSSIFGTLLFLPVETFWEIIRNSCYNNDLPKNVGKLVTYEFWPRWSSDDTTNSNFVEPDLFLRFEELDVIVEAKRWDDKQQSQTQLKNEFRAYLNEYGKEAKEVFIFAVGGLHSEEKESIGIGSSTTDVFKFRWKKILEEVQLFRKSLSLNKERSNSTESFLVILNTLIVVFRIHGFSTGKWFEGLEVKEVSGIKTQSLDTIGKWKKLARVN